MINKIYKMIAVFNSRQKRQLVGLTFIILIQAMLELVGVSIILPFIDCIMQPETLLANPYISMVLKAFHLSQNSLIIYICVAIICIYIIKNLFLIFLTNIQYKFSYYGKRDLSNRFMKCYLYQDYNFHLVHNSAELMRDISSDTNMFYTTVLNFVQLISEMVICVVLVGYLLLQDTLITIGVAVSLSLMLLFFMGNYKKVLVSLGNQRRYYTYKMTQSMQQGFGGIKEIKISNKEDFFLQEFSDANKKNAEAERRNVFLNAVPKPVMESLCITGLMLVIAVKIALGVDSSAFIKTLAVFAVAAFRLLPSVNKISGYIGNILHNGVVIEEVHTKEKQIRQMEQEISQSVYEVPIEFREKISVENLIFKYPEAENNVLENVSLDIYKNQSVAFIGPTGAGKTTLVDLILGLLEPTEGRVLVDTHDISESLYHWRELVGYIPQNIYMLDDTIRNNVLFGTEASAKDEDAVWEALREAQLDEFVRTLPEGLDTMIGEAGVRLSGGQRQRIGIARALFRKPQVLVLDEATSALDNNTETAVMEAVEHLQGKLTIIIIAHRLTTIRNCDVIYEVCDKNVVRKEKEEVLA